MLYVPRAALILTASNSFIGRLVRWGSNAHVSHSLLVTEGGWWPGPCPLCTRGSASTTYPEPIITESDATVRTGPLSLWHANDPLTIWDLDLTEEERGVVAGDVGAHQGRPYAVLQLFGQLIDAKVFGGRNVFRRLAKYDPLDICSHLTGDAFQRVGITFGEPGYAQCPGDQDRALRAAVEGTGLVCGRRVRCLLDEIGPKEEREV